MTYVRTLCPVRTTRLICPWPDIWPWRTLSSWNRLYIGTRPRSPRRTSVGPRTRCWSRCRLRGETCKTLRAVKTQLVKPNSSDNYSVIRTLTFVCSGWFISGLGGDAFKYRREPLKKKNRTKPESVFNNAPPNRHRSKLLSEQIHFRMPNRIRNLNRRKPVDKIVIKQNK